MVLLYNLAKTLKSLNASMFINLFRSGVKQPLHRSFVYDLCDHSKQQADNPRCPLVANGNRVYRP